MKPKEKARELILKMWDSNPNRIYDKTKELTEDNYLGIDDAISSALICIEENLKIIHNLMDLIWFDKKLRCFNGYQMRRLKAEYKEQEDVKDEIEKL